MNSIWNKNISLFIERFPVLAENFNITKETEELPSNYLAPVEIIPSRQKVSETDFLPTAKENGKLLHSLYNPLREAEQTAENAKKSGRDIYSCAFFGCGLGYAANAYAKKFPNDTIIIVESDARYFFTALALTDWTPLFSIKNLVIALQTGIESIVALIEKCGGFSHCAVSALPAQTEHAKDYFAALNSLIERNKRKNQINNSTLEKFSGLWLRNSCRNLHHLFELDGINIYKEKLQPEIPAVILAAGPTLQEILPHLEEIKKKCILIAVDTALRACLKAEVEPDFIVLADPQYYAYRHIAGLKSPSSILLTESAAYPPVFRFSCRKKVMCSSLFPLGKFIESKIGIKGELSAGGSVSTTAWDFARFIGAKEIIFSGLDLGFPSFQTHIKGSTFEEKIHTTSTRLSPAEKAGCASLFGANMEVSEDYCGESILTDNRMKMFSWWFESRQEEFSHSIKSYSLSEKSLRIPGFRTMKVSDFLTKSDIEAEKTEFFNKSESNLNGGESLRISLEKEVLSQLNEGLSELYKTAKEGLQQIQSAYKNSNHRQRYIEKLSEIDSKILASEFKDIASLVFPTEKKLNEIFDATEFSSDKIIASLQHSKIIYEQLQKSIRNYQKNLFSC